MSKCTRCKREFTPKIKKNNTPYKTCEKCRQKDINCRNRNKCEHNKKRSQCKECGGVSICEHNKRRLRCKICRGSQICEHNKIHSTCKACGGNSICKHNIIRSICKACGGGHVCKHNKRRSVCKLCGGASICKHNRIRSRCKDCGGGSICEHNKNRSQCKECGGSQICSHNKIRSGCIICTPKKACQNCKAVYVDMRSRFHPYCFTCYCVLNPDIDIPRQYKLKEHHLRNYLKSEFKEVSMVFDKACGKFGKRPDVLIDCQTYCIIIECDENQHKSYSCNERRCMEIFVDLKNRPLVMLRFNPDKYMNSLGEKISGCFTTTKTVGFKVNKNEWEKRMEVLIEKIWFYKVNIPEKELTVEYLFYDEV